MSKREKVERVWKSNLVLLEKHAKQAEELSSILQVVGSH